MRSSQDGLDSDSESSHSRLSSALLRPSIPCRAVVIQVHAFSGRLSRGSDWRDEWGASAVSLVAEKHGGGLAMVVTQKRVIRMDEEEDDECHKRKRDAE